MCGRFTLTSPRQVVEQTFDVDLGDVELGDAPRFNVAPSQDVLSIAIGRDGDRKAIPVRWGLIPSWSKDGKQKGSTINARIESALTSPTYRDSFRRWRCIIPADGFYEWHAAEGASVVGGKPTKQPYWIAREGGEPFAFAGLYSVWRARADDSWLLSCSILTEPAAGSVERIHDRMPVILHPSRWEAWLDRDLKDATAARELLQSDPGELRLHPISTLVNSPDNDGPELLREVST